MILWTIYILATCKILLGFLPFFELVSHDLIFELLDLNLAILDLVVVLDLLVLELFILLDQLGLLSHKLCLFGLSSLRLGLSISL